MIDNTENTEQSRVAADCPNERVVMREIRDEFTANAEHFDSTMMKLLNQNERLIKTVEYLDAKITSARKTHARAVPVLLDEALNRTHLDA